MLFADVPGSPEVKQRLIRTVRQQKIPHSQLFSGITGGNALALALAYITYMTCDAPGEEDACGVCPACEKNRKYVHPDVHFVMPVVSTDKFKGSDVVSRNFLPSWRKFLLDNPFGDLDDWLSLFGGENKQALIRREESREIIKDLSLRPFEADYKVLLMWMPETLHISAANALLKILEEPSARTIFIMVTYDYEQLLPTIISRSQLITIPPLKDEELAAFLTERLNVDNARAEVVTNLADGSVGEAIRLSTGEGAGDEEEFQEWMRQCYARNYEELVIWTDKFAGMNKMGQRSFLQYGTSILREALVSEAGTHLHRIHGKTLEFVNNFGKVLNTGRIERIYRELDRTLYHLERNANAKIVFLDLSIKVGEIIRGKN